jgi:hypothetical protein
MCTKIHNFHNVTLWTCPKPLKCVPPRDPTVNITLDHHDPSSNQTVNITLDQKERKSSNQTVNITLDQKERKSSNRTVNITLDQKQRKSSNRTVNITLDHHDPSSNQTVNITLFQKQRKTSNRTVNITLTNAILNISTSPSPSFATYDHAPSPMLRNLSPSVEHVRGFGSPSPMLRNLSPSPYWEYGPFPSPNNSSHIITEDTAWVHIFWIIPFFFLVMCTIKYRSLVPLKIRSIFEPKNRGVTRSQSWPQINGRDENRTNSEPAFTTVVF